MTLVIPDAGKTPITVYAEGGSKVHLVVPIKYCYDRAKIVEITRTQYDEMRPFGEPPQPTDGQANLSVDHVVSSEGTVIELEFVMPSTPASLQVWYDVAWSTPRWGSRRNSRYLDLHLTPEAQPFDEFVESLR